MIACLRHRGPDDSGVWSDDEVGVGMAQARLSIIDLSPAGHQPMISASGRYVVVFNGEAYNHAALRRELRDVAFRGRSDTEALVAGIDRWGIEETLRRAAGMLALAVWDRDERCLWLARDRLGKKPLFYGWSGGVLLFGSELKALESYPGFAAQVDPGAVRLYRRFNYVPAPLTIYTGIRKLPPGTFVRIDPRRTGVLEQPVQYWSLDDVVAQGRAARFTGSAEQMLDELHALLSDAVGLRLESDVPLGALLSGGVDSTLVVALMQQQVSTPVRTFTIGFGEVDYSEADVAAEAARILGTDHTELRVTPSEAMAVIPSLPDIYDEPFADASQIPTALVCRLARRHVTVALSGDGGDELFAGYNRYVWGNSIWRRTRLLPYPLRRAAAGTLRLMSAPVDRLLDLAGYRLPRRLRPVHGADLLRKLARVIEVRDLEEAYLRLVSNWGAEDGSDEPLTLHRDRAAWPRFDDGVEWMMYLDTLTYLPDDILTKVDRASMAVALELRAPLLDHRVVEFAWRLPLSLRMKDGRAKWPLRALLRRYVPDTLIDRPKMGFGVPVGAWLRGPLREWAEELLRPAALRDSGFNAERVRELWRQHQTGRDWTYDLWNVLMYQAWTERRNPAAAQTSARRAEALA